MNLKWLKIDIYFNFSYYLAMSQGLKKIPATQMKNNFGHYLTEAIRHPQPIYIEKHGQAVAVLVSMKQWREATGEAIPRKNPLIEGMRRLVEDIRRTHPHQTPAVQLLRELRDEES